MRSTFFGIELTKRALFAQQRAMDVASHNIANANNPVYSRQRADMVATAPYAPPGSAPAGAAGQVGTGVWVRAIERLRDRFLDERIRAEGGLLSEWQVRRDVLEQVERLLAEPSDNGLRSVMDQFWQALQDLSVQPESIAVREVVVQRGQVLAATVRQIFAQLQQLRVDIDRTVELKVGEVNTIVQRLAALNGQIARIVASGQRPNDLLDERDGLLERLGQLASVTVNYRPVGSEGLGDTVSVSIGGLTLVDGETFHTLAMSGQAPDRTIVWDGTGPQVAITGGEIGAYLELRGTAGPTPTPGFLLQLMTDLDTLASAFAEEFNNRHAAGLDLDGNPGGDFFAIDANGNGWVADDLQVFQDVIGNPRLIAAARPDPNNPNNPTTPGDGSNALYLARLKSDPLPGLGVSAPDFYAAMVGRVGVLSQQAQTMAENQDLVLQQLRTTRESISGVSLDEEMADLVRFEHAYGAAARAMTALDDVLDTLINRTGLVGR